MGETTNRDELFKVSGDSQAVNVEGNIEGNLEGNIEVSQNPTETHHPQPAEENTRVDNQPSSAPKQPVQETVIEGKVDTDKTPLQQRIAKVKRRSADISQQLASLNSAQIGATESASE